MLCQVCESNHFENIDGFYYCTVCGTKSQNVVDIEHSEEEIEHVGHELEGGGGGRASSDRKRSFKYMDHMDNEATAGLGANFTTFHVYTRLLKRQCDDLVVKLNANPHLKHVVMTLWRSYLNKLQIELKIRDDQHDEEEDDEIVIKSSRWLRWQRDKLYYQLNNTSSISGIEIVKMELDREKENDKSVESEQQEDEDEEDQEEEYSSHDGETSVSNSSSRSDKNAKPLSKLEWIRMPHMISILNLGLLILKSQILLTDLIRFINQGEVSYYNIDQVLPDTMRFVYGVDSIMFNVTSIPRADQLRLLTVKLGHFLGLGSIELIPLEQICRRFIFDLNLPTQLNELVRLLQVRVTPPEQLFFVTNSDELSINLEGIALSYIYSVILVFIFYKFEETGQSETNSRRDFVFTQWLDVMCPCLKQARDEILGCKIEEARSVKKLKSVKLVHFKHRHKTNTKAYISQYRRRDLLDTLRKPLEDKIIEKEEIEMRAAANLIPNRLFYLVTKLDNLDEEENLLVGRSIAKYITNEKIDIVNGLKSYQFEQYLEQKFLNTKQRGAYVVGDKYSGLDWLLDRFHELSQTGGYFKLYDLIKRILVQLK